jgi:hypothetical protein
MARCNSISGITLILLIFIISLLLTSFPLLRSYRAFMAINAPRPFEKSPQIINASGQL